MKRHPFVIIPVLIIIVSTICLAQVKPGTSNARSFDEPIISDSSSTMLPPYRYSAGLFTSDKVMTLGNYYANIIVYNFKSDSYKKLFSEDTYIQSPHVNY